MPDDGRRLPEGMTPLLLGRDAAAAYCGMSAPHFDRHVAPFVNGQQFGNKTLWHVGALKRWLDARYGLSNATASIDKKKLLEALNGDQNEGR